MLIKIRNIVYIIILITFDLIIYLLYYENDHLKSLSLGDYLK